MLFFQESAKVAEVAAPATINSSGTNSALPNGKPLHSKRDLIPYPARLPKLSEHLVRLSFSEDSVYLHQKLFVRHWGEDLKERTNSSPTRSDYYNYSLTVVETFPILKGGKNGIVRTRKCC